ncbi:hypothetical protein ACLMAJ_27765 [Nocardia sp. KC 131]|uniref:hypothetical protein n=1 Tax=Nocardia arseniciresistens TaxID=3392119 RepID=UPI00398F7C79
MDHGEPGGESIGALLSSLATTLRDVSSKLDAVAARVDEDRDDSDVVERLAKLEAWAFRASDDMTKLDSRLERVESGAEPSLNKVEPPAEGADGGHVESPKLPSRAQRRQATAIPPVSDQSQRTPTAPFEAQIAAARRDPALAVTPDTRIEPAPAFRNERLEPPAPTTQNQQLESATITPRTPRSESTTAPSPNEPFGPATHSEPLGTRNSRVEQTAPTFGNERLEPLTPSARGEWMEAAPSTHAERPAPAASRSIERLAPPAQTAPNDWPEYAPATGNGRLEPPAQAPRNDRVDYSNGASSNGRSETTQPRPDTGMTTPRSNRTEPVAIPQGAHRAAAPPTEDTSHVDKLQAMLDELKRNGPFGARPETSAPNEMPGIDPHFAVRTEG